MKNIQQNFLTDAIDTDDELDELFFQLEQFEPPADMVQYIMGVVSRLPLPQYLPAAAWREELEVEGLVVRREQQQPS